MHRNETIADFERNLQLQNTLLHKVPFRFFSSADCKSGNKILYRQRDFYKVSLLEGDYIVHYGDESIRISGVSLSFFSPSIPYTIEEIHEKENSGYFIFTELYYDTFFKQSILDFPLFNWENKPIFLLNEKQIQIIREILYKIEQQNYSDYSLKDDLIRNYINELMHYANSLQPASERSHQMNAKK